jgi:hypothetical protein
MTGFLQLILFGLILVKRWEAAKGLNGSWSVRG